jgi:ParB-like chromosome segregation protein Spo0J
VHDGHTRRLAAITAGIEKVPVVIEKFADEMAALEDFVKRQLKRRKNDPWVRYQMIIAVDGVMERGGDRRSEDAKSKTPGGVIEKKGMTSAERTAKLVDCGPRTVDRVRRISKAGKPEILDALKNRKMTITQADEAIGRKTEDKKASQKAELKKIRKAAEKLLNEDNLAGIDSLGEGLVYHVNKAVAEYVAKKLEETSYRVS